MQDLSGQVALVSGANRGLGAGTAAALASRGATVYAGTRALAALEGVDQEAPAIHPIQLDVRDEASMEAAVAAVPSLDILVNNAGVGDWHGSALHSLDAQALDDVFAVNIRGAMLLTKHALPKLLEAPNPRVVNVSSGMGNLDGMGGGNPAYRISKTALNGLTTYLHGEYGPRGLVASSVCPGWVRTDMGGPNAHLSLDEGVDTIVWLAEGGASEGGKWWRSRQQIPW